MVNEVVGGSIGKRRGAEDVVWAGFYCFGGPSNAGNVWLIGGCAYVGENRGEIERVVKEAKEVALVGNGALCCGGGIDISCYNVNGIGVSRLNGFVLGREALDEGEGHGGISKSLLIEVCICDGEHWCVSGGEGEGV